MRLIGGSYQWEGRVEIFFAGSWGTITDSDWTNEDAQAVCRMMGYFRPGKTVYYNKNGRASYSGATLAYQRKQSIRLIGPQSYNTTVPFSLPPTKFVHECE